MSVFTIIKREFLSYRTSLIFYTVAASFLFLAAISFYADLTLSLTVKPIRPDAIPSFFALGMIFFAPVMTMRSLAEEKREGTMELLLTAPITDTALVLGKFMSIWLYYTLLLFSTLAYQYMLLGFGQTQDMGQALTSYMGIWLYGGASLSIGMLYSAMTENQIVAAFLCSTTLLFLYLGNLVGEVVPSIELAWLFNELSFQGHYANTFALGVVRLEDIVYFVGVIAIALFISIRLVQGQRVN